jgi:acetyl-CoA carboxylase/biotin carboxylase 1
MVGLVKTNKDKLSTVMSLAMAHRELPRRNKLISAAIRQLQALQERTGAVTRYAATAHVANQSLWHGTQAEFISLSLCCGCSSAVADNLMSLLDRTSRLPGKEYGEVAISAAQALLTLRTPPFNARLAELRNTLIKSKDSLDALARSTTLTAGVDLLTALFTDKDVRNSAIGTSPINVCTALA